ncbi:hypothetical protein J2129_000720 [Methanofollis sp. W23]|nr:hypothetical protein [Methanofollis sp. W23]
MRGGGAIEVGRHRIRRALRQIYGAIYRNDSEVILTSSSRTHVSIPSPTVLHPQENSSTSDREWQAVGGDDVRGIRIQNTCFNLVC